MDIENYNVPDNTKVAQLFIELAIQEKSRNELARKLARDPVSLLNAFSSIYERYTHNLITPFVNIFMSELFNYIVHLQSTIVDSYG